MSAKCAICKRAFVNAPGQVCITCKMRQQPYQVNQPLSQQTTTTPIQPERAVIKNDEPIQQIQTVTNNSDKGAKVRTRSYVGIVQNVHQSEIRKGFLRRWCSSILYGSPMVFSDTQYEFSLYLQGNYTAERVQGKEVVFYGDPGYCFLSNNSTVRVYGVADRNGVIIADEISGINTSFRMRPKIAIPGIVVRLLSAAILIIAIVAGIIGAMNQDTGANCTLSADNLLFTIICMACAWVVLKLRIPKRLSIAAVLVAVGLMMVSPMLSCVIFGVLLLGRMIKGK